MSNKIEQLTRSDPPLATGASAIYPYSVKLEKQYRFKTRFDEDVELFHRSLEGHFICLPRALCPVSSNDQREDGVHVVFPLCPKPKPEQAAVFAKVMAAIQAGQSGLVSAYTGWGKTVLGYFAAYCLQRKTLIVTTKTDIFQQWIKDAPKFLGIDKTDVGRIQGTKCDVEGKKFVVAMIHSLATPDKYPAWITEDFGLVIFDECHRLPAPQFQRCAWMIPAKIRLGFSATLERSDGKELVVQAHVGPLIAQTEAELMVPKVLRFKTAWKCPRRILIDTTTGERVSERIEHSAGKSAHVEKMLAYNTDRNTMLAEMIKEAYAKGRRSIVLSTTLDHLDLIEKACLAQGIDPKHLGHYSVATTAVDLAAREKVKVLPLILSTYQMMGEGTNLPWIDTMFLTMPRAKVVQPVGRIRREYSDKRPPVVFDFIDEDSHLFFAYARSRLTWYKSIGCEVVDIN